MSITKGPWSWNLHEGDSTKESTLVGANGETVCDFGDSEQYYPSSGWSGSDDDMALIAAAPDLLEALKAIERIGDNDPDCNHCGEYLDAREIARKAIAKAEGRE